MPDASMTISGDLTEYLVDLVQPLLDERGLVVWYDRDGALEKPLSVCPTSGFMPPYDSGTRHPFLLAQAG